MWNAENQVRDALEKCDVEDRHLAVKQAIGKAGIAYRLRILCGVIFTSLVIQVGGWGYSVSNAYSEPQQNPNQAQRNNSSSSVEFVKNVQGSGRIESQLDTNSESHQKNLRRKIVEPETKEPHFSKYIDAWMVKVTRIGVLSFPEEASRKKIYGSLMLGVSIRADGSLENIEIIQSSGHRILDVAARRTVHYAAPFAPFPPEIAKDVDVLTIIRKWTFTPPQGTPIENKQSSESGERKTIAKDIAPHE